MPQLVNQNLVKEKEEKVMTSKENYWWGYCKKDSIGWVLLDRTFNKPGQTDLYFINCQKNEIYKESKENWNNPNFYVFENRFFEKLPQEHQKIFATQLSAFKIRIEEFKENLVVFEIAMKVNQFKKLRQRYFSGLGIVDPGEIDKVGKARRISHCYSCKVALDSNFQRACLGCKWMICSRCGACGCGYSS